MRRGALSVGRREAGRDWVSEKQRCGCFICFLSQRLSASAQPREYLTPLGWYFCDSILCPFTFFSGRLHRTFPVSAENSTMVSGCWDVIPTCLPQWLSADCFGEEKLLLCDVAGQPLTPPWGSRNGSARASLTSRAKVRVFPRLTKWLLDTQGCFRAWSLLSLRKDPPPQKASVCKMIPHSHAGVGWGWRKERAISQQE